MPPLITEAQILELWPLPQGMSLGAWVDTYATHLSELVPGIAASAAHSRAPQAFVEHSTMNPKLAALCDVVLETFAPPASQ